MNLDFAGQTVLVTGGTRGIGAGIAALFLAAGARVVVCGRNPPPGPTVGVRFVPCDLREPEQIDRLVQDVLTHEKCINVLVNNAGGSPAADAATASPRFSRAIVALNLTAALDCAQRVNAVMQGQSGGGVILNIASVSGTRPSPGTAAYGAAKAGLLSLTGSLAVEWAPRVRINAIVAGLVDTPAAHAHYGGPAGVAAVAATVPMARLATPDDIAAACLFLASPHASYITGAALTVDGGGERPAFLGAANTG